MTLSVLRAAALAPVLLAAAAAAALLAGAPAFAQAETENSTLSLSATGEVQIAPDLAIVTGGVQTRADSAAAAVRANAEAMSRVFAALRRAGVAEADLQTTGLSVQPVYPENRDRYGADESRITGYEASNQVSATLRDLDAVGVTIDALFAAGATTLDGVRFESTGAEAAQDEARRRAVARLGELRDLYAEAAGFEVVRLRAFSEAFDRYEAITVSGARLGGGGAPTPVAPGMLTVSANVSAVWEIEG